MKVKSCALLLGLAVIVLAGCDSDKKQLTGKVTFSDGKPVTSGKVLFSNATYIATGDIQKDGSYRMGSLTDRDGLPPGDYMVSVSGVTKTAPDNAMVYLPLCEERFTNPQQSGLRCTIPVAGNRYDIELEPHPVNYP